MLLRTTRSVLLLGGLLASAWFAFVVPLGDRTLSEHIDAISRTPEARGLIRGARQTIAPWVEEAKDRIFGEYVEAPTAIPRIDGLQDTDRLRGPVGPRAPLDAPQTAGASEPGRSKLPGQSPPEYP